MSTSRLAGLAIVLFAIGSRRAGAQFPPERATNLKVLPRETPVSALLDTMARFTRALGVRCAYCHAGGDSVPFDKLNFASDEKVEKLKAREMLRLVAAINADYLPKLPSRREPAIRVSCATCHHGVAEPRPLQQILVIAYDAGGVDSADAAYRALRRRYYGAAAYDFGEVPLADVADSLRVRGRPDDAVRLHAVNIEFSPNSGFARRQAAAAQLAVGDTAGAIANLERAIEINASDQQARRALARLKPNP